MADYSEYVERGRAYIMSTLSEHHAVVRPELEARLSERYYAPDKRNLDPHHVTNALRSLIDDGVVVRLGAASKGGRRPVETIQPAQRANRATKIEQAARRKRALYARYRGWAQGTVRHPQGLIGPAGEQAVRDAIVASSVMLPLTPGAGEAGTVLGVKLNGAVDSAGYLVPVIGGLPQAPITTIVEVKNIRPWIYPHTEELFQVLDKGIQIQLANPSQPVLPILVCRKAHPTVFYMAKQLGFVVLEMNRQFTGTAMSADEVNDVRNELAFADLTHGIGPSLRVRDRLRKSISPNAIDFAYEWSKTTIDLGTLITPLRTKMSNQVRESRMSALREASGARGDDGGW